MSTAKLDPCGHSSGSSIDQHGQGLLGHDGVHRTQQLLLRGLQVDVGCPAFAAKLPPPFLYEICGALRFFMITSCSCGFVETLFWLERLASWKPNQRIPVYISTMKWLDPSLVPNPFCKPLTMDVCKVNCWVPYNMVALTSPGKCAGGHQRNIAIDVVGFLLASLIVNNIPSTSISQAFGLILHHPPMRVIFFFFAIMNPGVVHLWVWDIIVRHHDWFKTGFPQWMLIDPGGIGPLNTNQNFSVRSNGGHLFLGFPHHFPS